MDRFQILSPNLMRDSVDERATGTFVNTTTSQNRMDSHSLEGTVRLIGDLSNTVSVKSVTSPKD
jgi:hypothetical protein